MNRLSRTFFPLAGLVMLGREAAANPLTPPVPVQINIFGLDLDFSHDTIIMCAVVAVLVWFVCWLCTRNLSQDNPGRGQALLELFVKAFDGLVRQSMGPKRGRKLLPYIGTLFLFLWTGNMIGMIPFPLSDFHVRGEGYHDYNHNHRFDPGEWDPARHDANGDGKHNPGFPLPKFKEPTENLNVPLGLALLFVLMIGHGAEIRIHGIGGYIKSYFSPGGFIGFAMFPLNLVGKIAEIVSISFRLFGNIFGGVVIITVVSGLLAHMVIPIGLFGFFGIFVGTIQAFVFTMLALTYISMGAAEE